MNVEHRTSNVGRRLNLVAVLLFRVVVVWACLWVGGVVVDGAPVTALAFLPDSSGLISGRQGGIDVLRGRGFFVVERRISLDLGKVCSLAFHPSGEWLAVAGGTPGVGGAILVLDWPEGRERFRCNVFRDVATSVAFGADGDLMGGASADSGARVWRAADGEEMFALRGHAGPVLGLAFGPKGRTVVTAGGDRSVKVWSTDGGRLLRQFDFHTEPVHAVAFRPTGLSDSADMPVVCATGGEDRTVRVWQPVTGRMVRIVRGHEGAVFAVMYGVEGRRLYSAGEEGVIREIDALSDRIVREDRRHDDWIYALAVSPDGTLLASGDWSGLVRTWPVGGAP